MEAADTKVIKGIKEFLEDFVSKYEEFCFSTADTLKSKDQERGDLAFSLNVKPYEFPDVFDEEGYLKSLKKKFEEQLGKKVRYFQISWSYTEDSCCILFVIKFA
jgi:hypothetical protein